MTSAAPKPTPLAKNVDLNTITADTTVRLTPKPKFKPQSEIIITSGKKLDMGSAKPNLVKSMAPKPVSRPRTERSAPVRNPAFREHPGLRDLQKQLNSRPNKNK